MTVRSAPSSQQPSSRFRLWRIVCWVCGVFAIGCGSRNSSSNATLAPRELRCDAERLSVVEFSPDGRSLAAGGANGEVFVWPDVNASPKRLDSGRAHPLLALRWSPDRLLVSTDLENGFVGWQFGKAEPDRLEFPGLGLPAVCLAFRPASTTLELVLGLRDGSLFFFDPRGTKQLRPDHRGPVKQVAYSPDGRWLVSAGADGQLIWRDANSRKVALVGKAHEAEISQLAFAPDGQRLATGDWNGVIKIWDAASRQETRRLVQPEAVCGLGWLNETLVSAGWDGWLRVWNLTSGQTVRNVDAGSPIQQMSVDPRASRIATVHLDRAVRLWQFPGTTK